MYVVDNQDYETEGEGEGCPGSHCECGKIGTDRYPHFRLGLHVKSVGLEKVKENVKSLHLTL